MTMVCCLRCGAEMHYTCLAFAGDDEYKGLCSECFIEELWNFVKGDTLDFGEAFLRKMEREYGIKNGEYLLE